MAITLIAHLSHLNYRVISCVKLPANMCYEYYIQIPEQKFEKIAGNACVIAGGRRVHMLNAQDIAKIEFTMLSLMRDVCAPLL